MSVVAACLGLSRAYQSRRRRHLSDARKFGYNVQWWGRRVLLESAGAPLLRPVLINRELSRRGVQRAVLVTSTLMRPRPNALAVWGGDYPGPFR